ncbi:MAG: roadblock/LC7 domain-containing protein [Proteobacteria bacterium]|nr:roadblock/LC7 domain-containing protein [Pseudomonadota bacterium]
MIFEEVLRDIVEEADGVQGAVIMGMDGIPIGEKIIDPDCSIQTVGIEYASAIKNIQKASESLSAGRVQEVVIDTQKGIFLLRLVTDDYFIAVALSSRANYGKIRYHLRIAAPKLEGEFR